MKSKIFNIKRIAIIAFTMIMFICAMLASLLINKSIKKTAAADESWSAPSADANGDGYADGTVEVYQLAPNNHWLMMSYVIRTENGKLIVIDGGADSLSSATPSAFTGDLYLTSALRAIAGVKDGEYFEVEAWFLSHAHKDHFNQLARQLEEYSIGTDSNYKINNFYFDFPEFGTSEYTLTNSDQDYLDYFKTHLNAYATKNNITVPSGTTYYDMLNGAVINAAAINAGLTIEIDGVKFDVLQTWDAADITYTGDANNVNNTSVVYQMWVDDTSFLFLGDASEAAVSRLVAKYTTEELTSDYVQMAHHGQDACTVEQYQAMGVTSDNKDQIYLWPTANWIWNSANDSSYPELIPNYNNANGTLHTGETFPDSVPDPTKNIVAGHYSAYPSTQTSVDAWNACLEAQRVAKIKTTVNSYTIEGAQVREKTPEGFRFVTSISKEEKAKYDARDARYGLLVMPAEKVAEGEELTISLTVSGGELTKITPSKHGGVSSQRILTEVW